MTHPKLALVAILCLAVAFAAVPANAAARQDLATINVGSAAVVWQPKAAYDTMVLTVSGPHGVSRHEFGAGVMPSLDIFATDGYPLADGSYTWELRAQPAVGPQAKRALDTARASGDYTEVEALRQQGVLPDGPLAQSGSFAVAGGAFVSPDLDEEAGARPASASSPVSTGTGDGEIVSMSAADQVILDDLIVDGSACIGQDCVNGESFGFDTLRLKENNLRIKFDDTSSSASFPNFDWQLTANETSNGGANKFSIDDVTSGRTPFTIEGSAPSHSLYVDDGGRIGFGTSTPVVELHLVDGDTPTLRLEQDGSSGFTPQTWDVAGNETNYFIRDATNGSRLPFKIRPSAPTNSMYIHTDGNVGLGTASPDQRLDIDGGAAIIQSTTGVAALTVAENSATQASRTPFKLQNNGQLFFQLIRTDGSSGTWSMVHDGTNFNITKAGTGANEMSLADNGNVEFRGTVTGSVASPSARALKTGFEALDPQDVLSRLMDVPVVRWQYTERDPGMTHMGPMAEDFNAAFGVGKADGIFLVDANGVAMAAIQGLNQVVEAKEARLEELEQENAELAARLAALEALVERLAQ